MEEQKLAPQPQESQPQEAPPPPQMPSSQPKVPLSKGEPKGEPKKLTFPTLPKPHPSFIVAITTILLTIAAGIAIAIILGKLTQRGIKEKGETYNAPMVTTTPTLPLETSGSQAPEAASPSGEASPSGSFENMLEENINIPSASEASEATFH